MNQQLLGDAAYGAADTGRTTDVIARTTLTTCPACSAAAANVQGVAACIECDWTAR